MQDTGCRKQEELFRNTDCFLSGILQLHNEPQRRSLSAMSEVASQLPYMVSSPFARLSLLMTGTGCCRISGLFSGPFLAPGLDDCPPIPSSSTYRPFQPSEVSGFRYTRMSCVSSLDDCPRNRWKWPPVNCLVFNLPAGAGNALPGPRSPRPCAPVYWPTPPWLYCNHAGP